MPGYSCPIVTCDQPGCLGGSIRARRVCIPLRSDDEQTAFQQALEIGRLGEDIHTEGRREVETRLAEVVRLDCVGSDQTQFEVRLGSSKARERLPFEHIFKPEERMPEPAF